MQAARRVFVTGAHGLRWPRGASRRSGPTATSSAVWSAAAPSTICVAGRHRARRGRRAGAPDARARAWRAATPSCTWSASSASSRATASRSSASTPRARGTSLEAATAAGVRRYVHMSALGTRPDARSRYHRTQVGGRGGRARESRSPGRSSVRRSSTVAATSSSPCSGGMIERLPVVPVIGSGRQQLQPVPVEQVAQGFARALEPRRRP